jgi:uncharacterized protein YceH (UPF0502 family)
MIDSATDTSSSTPQRRWQPLGAMDRRVVGVLAEKAKTTPDTYPMSLNAVCTGCNQKNNRAPLMQINPEEAEGSLDRLREFGAVGLVEGYGRVAKYRHYLYEWLGVDKVELAVMTELLLRGDQTVGELRVRAARMEPIPDLAALRPVLESLRTKGLVVSLTPEGRGHVVTHALYKPRELELLRTKYQGYSAGEAIGSSEEDAGEQLSSTPTTVVSKAIQRTPISAGFSSAPNDAAALRRELEELRNQVAQLRADFDELHIAHQTVLDELHTLKDALGG